MAGTKKRIKFTAKELNAIIEMACIAEAGAESEGDYQTWTPSTYKAASSAALKAGELLGRLPKGDVSQ